MKRITAITIAIIINIFCLAKADQQAGSYSVQIASYKNLPDTVIKSAEKYGSVHTSPNGDLTRVSVGSFNNKSAAQNLLSQLKQAGYKDAFISRINSSVPKNQNQSNHHQNKSLSSPIGEMTKFHNLPDSDKERAVFIDGKLHLKDDHRFILVP